MLTATVTRRDRTVARQAESVGRSILAKCRGLLAPHEIRVADAEDVPAGKPLISLLLYRLDAEAHAFFASSLTSDLARELKEAAKGMRGESRTALLMLAARIEAL